MKRTWLALTLLALAAPLAAQMPRPESVVRVRAEPAQLKGKPGAAVSFSLFATIQDGFHVNSNKPTQDYLIPTRVELLEGSPFELDKVDYPAGEMKSFEFAPGEELSVYEGTIKVPVRLRARTDATAGAHTVKLAFHYQACNDQVCLRPARRELALTVRLE
jgi:hypothetical protein